MVNETKLMRDSMGSSPPENVIDIDVHRKEDIFGALGENRKEIMSIEEIELRKSELFSLKLNQIQITDDTQRHLDVEISSSTDSADHPQYEHEVNSQFSPNNYPLRKNAVPISPIKIRDISDRKLGIGLMGGKGDGILQNSSMIPGDPPKEGLLGTISTAKIMPKKLTKGAKKAKKSEKPLKIQDFLERMRKRKEENKRKKDQVYAAEEERKNDRDRGNSVSLEVGCTRN